MDSFSLDTFCLVFLELEVFSLGYLSQVCTKWYHLLNAERNDSIFWESYYMKHFGGTRKLENWRLSIKSGVNVINSAKTNISSAIRSAVCQGMDKLTNTLLQQYKIDLSDPNVAREFGYPLHLATIRGDEATITVLLHHKCDTSLLNSQGKSPKQIAAEKANIGALLLVAPESALTDPQLFLNAVKFKRSAICMELIKIGVDVNFCGPRDMAIHIAAQNGLRPLIVEFLKKGTPVDAQNRAKTTALQLASQFGYPSIVRLLLKKGADPNYRLKKSQLNAFLFACKSNNPNQETLEILLEVTTDGVACSDNNQMTAIHILASRPTLANSQLIELLVDKYGAPVDLRDKQGRTPLHICISKMAQKSNNTLDMVETLCRMGSDPTDGLTEAINYNNLFDVANLLVQMGASVNTPNRFGTPPLFIALEKNSKSMVDYLLRCGSDLYYVCPNGWTALNSLIKSRYDCYDRTDQLDHIPLAKQIIQELGIDLTLPESDPHHVLDLSIMSGRDQMSYFLIRAGAKLHRTELLWQIESIHLLAELLQRKACPLPDNHLFVVYNFNMMYSRGDVAMLLLYLGADPGYRDENNENMTILEYVQDDTNLKEELMKAAQDPEYPVLFMREKNLLLSQMEV